ncbi:MAG: NAD(+) synthase [Deferribacteraceae bacterium]|jgi:NAD+ synthase|nr:NAD(+) synthase [Deferribacteraceae bacterium]
MFNKLVDGLRRAANDSGFSKAVLGLSGGVDSSVAAAIACKALQAENVILFYLPYNDTDPHGFTDAKTVADFLGSSLVYMDITRMADPYFDSLILPTERRRVNVLSRLRMLVLYDQSALYNALVIGAANKSEIMLGSVTLFGDGAYAINPLGNIYKTELIELARQIGLPDSVLSKAESPVYKIVSDNGEESTAAYTEIDKILTVLETVGYSIDAALEQGLQRGLVEKIAKLIKNSEFKRRAGIIIDR